MEEKIPHSGGCGLPVRSDMPYWLSSRSSSS